MSDWARVRPGRGCRRFVSLDVLLGEKTPFLDVLLDGTPLLLLVVFLFFFCGVCQFGCSQLGLSVRLGFIHYQF